MKTVKTGISVLSMAALIALGADCALAIDITTTTNANAMADNILGTGITRVGDATYLGGPVSSGTFINGAGEVGFASGLVLHTGQASQIPGPNNNSAETLGVGGVGDDDISVGLNPIVPGDADLTAIVGTTTNDAAVLQFDFQFGDGSVGGDLFFNYVFASEEYIDFVDSQFNDVFGFFLDGTNVALLPDGVTPVTINTVNPNTNSAFYVNNVPNTNGFTNAGRNIGFDGLTTVLTVSAEGLAPGVHTIKLAVADTSDRVLDSAVFIQGGTFSTDPNPPQPPVNNGAVPEPITATLGLMGLGVLGAAARRRRA